MRKPKQIYSPQFKAEVAIAAIQAGDSLAQLSRDFGVHRNQVRQWRDRLVDRAGRLFVESNDPRLLRRRGSLRRNEAAADDASSRSDGPGERLASS